MALQEQELELMGKKLGMSVVLDQKTGEAIPCTVILIEKNIVVQVKSKETDGYNAIQLGSGEVVTNDPRTVEKRVTKPLIGHFKKAGVAPRRNLAESRVENPEAFQPGQELGVELLGEEKFVDVRGVSKGKGYQGVMKRHNFAGGPAAHGSGFHRHGGSTGQRTSPGRCLPGTKMAGHMGSEKVTTESLKVLSFDPEEGVLIVKGAVPGPREGLVFIRAAMKKRKAKKK